MGKLRGTLKVQQPLSYKEYTKGDYSFWFSSKIEDWCGGAKNRRWSKHHNGKRKEAIKNTEG